MCLSRSGAGSTPYSRRMLAIVLRPTSCPRLALAPWIRVYPHRSILKRHAKNEIDDPLHEARPTGASRMAVVAFTCEHFSVPSQEGIRCDQGLKFVQDLTSKSVRFSGESTALGIGEANASPTQALREHAVLFLEIRDQVQLMAVDPPGEHHEQQLKRLKRWGHCSGGYELSNRRGSWSSRLAQCPLSSFEFPDTTGERGTKAGVATTWYLVGYRRTRRPGVFYVSHAIWRHG